MRNWFTGFVAGMAFAAGLLAQKAADVANGKDLFRQCLGCHNTDTDKAKAGPSLKALFKHNKLKSGKSVNEANVREIITAGGNGMPPFADELSDQEKRDLIAYLKTL